MEETRRQHLQEVREAQEQRADEIRRLQREVYEQKLSAHRARIAAAADQRRRELEEQQRAEAEALRILEEEAERIRRERERDCVVCLDTNDIEVMVEAPCAHWYCRVHLRGKLIVYHTKKQLAYALQTPSRLLLTPEHYFSVVKLLFLRIYCQACYQPPSALNTTPCSSSCPHPTRYIAPTYLAHLSFLRPKPVVPMPWIVPNVASQRADIVDRDRMLAPSAWPTSKPSK